jgi:hypothetical protein
MPKPERGDLRVVVTPDLLERIEEKRAELGVLHKSDVVRWALERALPSKKSNRPPPIAGDLDEALP